MRKGGKILANIIKQVEARITPGIQTQELDKLAEYLIRKNNAEPTFKNYKGFPKTLCACINNGIVHCVPDKTIIKKGDIITLDLGLKYYGYCLDMAVTIGIEPIAYETKRLIKVCKKALKLGIKKAKTGNTTGDIGNTIQRYVESQGFAVIKELCGHGIGKNPHEKPDVLNFGKRHTGEQLSQYQTICIEPMICNGNGLIRQKGIAYYTQDNSLSTHFEHTILITNKGGIILTQ